VSKFIEWFGKDKIDCLLADREFVGQKWINFLSENHIKYCIRIRRDFKVFCFGKTRKSPFLCSSTTFEKEKLYHHSNIVNINETKCYVSGLEMVDENAKDGLLKIISFDRPQE